MRLLLTRPEEDAVTLSAALRARGHEPIASPLLTVRGIATEPPDLSDVTALLFTSANGVRQFAALTPNRALPVYCVGGQTAATARQAGFAEIQSADGDVESLARLVGDQRNHASDVLLHVAGSVTAGDLAGRLREAGFLCRVAVVYETVEARSFDEPVRAALARGTIDGVLLYSPRTARQWVALIGLSGLRRAASNVDAWCLSSAVAEAIAEIPHRSVHSPTRPTQAALLDLIDARAGIRM